MLQAVGAVLISEDALWCREFPPDTITVPVGTKVPTAQLRTQLGSSVN
jgi:hypothetical protein